MGGLHKQSSASRGLVSILSASLVLVASGIVTAQGSGSAQLRRFIDGRVGGVWKLMVPAHDADLPQPRLADGTPDPLFQITEAKRYLGKQLFHDPIRTARILTEFGGVLGTKQTASCGSCHMGEAASKAGTLLNFAVGGEGRGYTDAVGNFIPRRRPRPELPLLRQTPLFPGDVRVDEIPTLTDIYELAVGSPARGASGLPDREQRHLFGGHPSAGDRPRPVALDRDDERQRQDQRWRSLPSSVPTRWCTRSRAEH
jgi:hypothetical protein